MRTYNQDHPLHYIPTLLSLGNPPQIAAKRRSKSLNKLFAAAAAVLLSASLMTQVSAEKFSYPEARKGDVVTNYHGTDVPDPYRWMEDPASQETMNWGAAENELTHSFIDAIPARARIEKRRKELWNYPRAHPP